MMNTIEKEGTSSVENAQNPILEEKAGGKREDLGMTGLRGK